MLHAVIMAGGSGTRFWPASRRHLPKQLLALATETPLLRMTFERLGNLAPVNRVWVVTTVETAQASRNILPELPPGNILSEPMGRNTAACAGLAAQAIQKVDPEGVCIVLPADHVIGEEKQFRSAMAAGAEFVSREGGLLTFGVRPTRPETGYGYLELGLEHSRKGEWSIHRLRQFVEKPDVDRTWRKGLEEKIRRLPLGVTCILGTTKITGRDLLEMKTDDIIRLDQKITDQVVVAVQGIPKFKGYPGVYNKRKAVRLEGRIDKE